MMYHIAYLRKTFLSEDGMFGFGITYLNHGVRIIYILRFLRTRLKVGSE